MTPLNADTFPVEFPYVAVCLTVGCTTTVEHLGKVYSFIKLSPGVFELVN